MRQLCQQNATWANVGGPVANLFRGAEVLCRLIAPLELADLPVYVVPQSALLADLGTAEACHGYRTPSLGRYLRDVIRPAGRGRGPCMVINDPALLEEPRTRCKPASWRPRRSRPTSCNGRRSIASGRPRNRPG